MNDASVPMSSSLVANDGGAEENTRNGEAEVENLHEPYTESGENGKQNGGGRIAELLQEERGAAPTPQPLGNGTNPYKGAQQIDNGSEDGSVETLPRREASPIDSLLSIPDDSPSVQVIMPSSHEKSC